MHANEFALTIIFVPPGLIHFGDIEAIPVTFKFNTCILTTYGYTSVSSTALTRDILR